MATCLTLSDLRDLNISVPPGGRDADLISRIRAGDPAAFESLYLEIHPRLFRFICRMVPNPDSAEDLVNETMLVVWENPDGYDFSCKLSTWIFGIAYHKALKASAKSGRMGSHVSVDDFAEVLPDRKPSDTRTLELDNWLSAALETLSPEQRAVIELTYYNELPYQEIALILGCPENTVKTRMFHARKKLKPLLKDLLPDMDVYFSEES